MKSIHTISEKYDYSKTKVETSHTQTLIGTTFYFSLLIGFLYSAMYADWFSVSVFLVILANVDMLSEVIAYAIPSWFRDVYNPDQSTVVSFISFNIVNLLAISGVLLNGLVRDWKVENMYVASIISYLITFLLPTPIIPMIQNFTETTVKSLTGLSKVTWEGVDLPKLIGGLGTMAFFIIAESTIIDTFVSAEGAKFPGVKSALTSLRRRT